MQINIFKNHYFFLFKKPLFFKVVSYFKHISVCIYFMSLFVRCSKKQKVIFEEEKEKYI